MNSNSIGRHFKMTTFGESHGKCVGLVIDGCPAGLQLSESDIQPDLDRRKPAQSSVTTARKEPDNVEILSGIFDGFTTGAPLCLIVWNKDADSKTYLNLVDTPRPGHSDYPALIKYNHFNDWRGGGRFSARNTVPYVIAGSIAKKILKESLGTDIAAYTVEIGGVSSKTPSWDDILSTRYSNSVRCPDQLAAKEMENRILAAKREGDSVGGIIECVSQPLPVGLGEPIFSSLDSDLSRLLFAIPAVKGVEFGSGFKSSKLTGSQNNDLFVFDDGKVITKTNNSGGILGGLSTGMPLITRLAFKPPSSIAKRQKTVNLDTKKLVDLRVMGRHDPCVLPRAVPIVEATVAIVLVDQALVGGFISHDLFMKRNEDRRK
uniref:Chorismate synthase n=1 Tax=uncultured marine thaumarchaeote AD1000_24_H07 TaxID=1455902 RepID=A0A075FSI0_9ARCH|nr:chorismate synthase (aroC) [uncultured marine thaumarchaeote AD1000_24_H07]